ncbi:hypothetical protein GW17_00034945 [Ensete ventricosum]|nr:hypothetical protein GW17_00034945 [Ensete ventricosum]RZS12198.1 hypothetical protein BHM03_00043616 [Ensete ventricosum]
MTTGATTIKKEGKLQYSMADYRPGESSTQLWQSVKLWRRVISRKQAQGPGATEGRCSRMGGSWVLLEAAGDGK